MTIATRQPTLGLVVLIIGCGATSVVPFDYSRHAGAAGRPKNGAPCLAIADSNLRAGTKVEIVWVPIGEYGPAPFINEATIQGPLPSGCDLPEARIYEDASYSISLPDDSLDSGTAYFALITSASRLQVAERSVQGDLDDDGVLEVLRTCTSMEGVHLTIWSGEPLKGSRRWHRYYYVGYDLEQTCIEADWATLPN